MRGGEGGEREKERERIGGGGEGKSIVLVYHAFMKNEGTLAYPQPCLTSSFKYKPDLASHMAWGYSRLSFIPETHT